MRKLIVAMLIGMFVFVGGGEKIFGSEKSVQAKIVLNGAEMKQPHFRLMKGFLYEAVNKGNFSEEMKAKCAEMIVWAMDLLNDKEVHDLSVPTDSLARLFRAVVGDINTFFSNPKLTSKDRVAAAGVWGGIGGKLLVKFVRITIKSKATGQTETKVDWEMTLLKKAVGEKKDGTKE